MAKYEPKTLQNLDNPPTAVSVINYNFDTLKLLVDTLLSRDGATPNTMQSFLDMNNNRILNLPVPVSPTEPARHGDIQQYVDQAQDWAEYAEEQADRAEAEADIAEAAAEVAVETLEEFEGIYVGAYATPPTIDPNGNPLQAGSLYWDTTLGQLHVYTIETVRVNTDRVVRGADIVLVSYWVSIPIPIFAGLSDVDVSDAVAGDYVYYNGVEFTARALSAENVTFDPDVLTSVNVQDAIDEILDRTSLGIYDIYIYAQGLPGNDEEIIRLNASRQFYLPVNGGQSTASLRVGPASTATTFTIRKNGTPAGTIVFDVSDTTGTFIVAGAVTFSQGDVLSITSATPDVTIRDLAVTLACVR